MYYTNVSVRGSDILVRGWDNDKKFFKKEKFKPTLYLPTNKESEFVSLNGKQLEALAFDSIPECKEFMYKYKDVHNFEMFGMENFILQYIHANFKDKIDYDYDQIDIGSLDIEVESEFGFPNVDLANEKINAITIYDRKNIITLGLDNYIPHMENVVYKQFKTEKEMLEFFVYYFDERKYDILIGWFINGFDIPYIINRIRKILGEEWVKKLSPWRFINEKKIKFGQNERTEYEIVGLSVIDLLDVYKKFSGKTQVSYKLDEIARVELGKTKVSYSEYGSLKDLYTKNYQKYIEYNIEDTILVKEINDKTNLLQLVLNLAYDAKTNFNDVFMNTVIWDSKIYGYLLNKNIVIPFKKRKENNGAFEGAYVKEPKLKKYKNVVTVDVTSEYPSLFMHYNISPETYLGKVDDLNLEDLVNGVPHKYLQKLKDKNISMAANGTLYRKDFKGFAPEMIEELFNERQQYKKLMLKAKDELENYKSDNNKTIKQKLRYAITKYNIFQLSKKVQLNAFYGAFGADVFRFYNLDTAEAITISGQHTIRWAARHINQFLNALLKTDNEDYIVYGDTDSLFIHLDPVVKKFVPEFKDDKVTEFLKQFVDKKIQPVLDSAFKEMQEYMNAYDQKIIMKREKICSDAIFVAKKRYILNINDDEGVRLKEPKISVTGIEAIRNSTPEKVREYLKETFKIIMNKNEKDVIKYIEDVKNNFYNMSPEEIAFPRGVSNVKSFEDKDTIYKKGTPIHSRAAILFNRRIEKMNLSNKYNYILDEDKIKFMYLKLPNPIHENVIAFNTILPPEFGLHDYIDYDTQFDKVYLNPLEKILEASEINLNNQTTLEDFFA